MHLIKVPFSNFIIKWDHSLTYKWIILSYLCSKAERRLSCLRHSLVKQNQMTEDVSNSRFREESRKSFESESRIAAF